MNSKKNNRLQYILIYIIALLFANVQAKANKVKVQNETSESEEMRSVNIEDDNVSDLFDRSYFRHTKGFYHNIGFLSKLREILNISIGGEKEKAFIGLGTREQTIQWDGEAILNTYNKILAEQTNDYQLTGSDIPNGFSSSLREEKFDF